MSLLNSNTCIKLMIDPAVEWNIRNSRVNRPVVLPSVIAIFQHTKPSSQRTTVSSTHLHCDVQHQPSIVAFASLHQLQCAQSNIRPKAHTKLVHKIPVAKCDWNSMGIFLSRQIQLNSHAVLFDRSGATNRIPVTLILRTG